MSYDKRYCSIEEKFIGIPYKLGGCGFDGADCVGISVFWLQHQGMQFDYYDGKGIINKGWFEKNPHRFIDAILKHGNIISFNELKKFDCLMLTLPSSRGVFPNSLAVMVDDRHFLASDPDRGSFVEMLNMDFKNMCWGALRLHQVKEKGI